MVGYSINSPTAEFWTNLATAVVFGLGIATVLTLIFTPAMLALRVWFWDIAHHLSLHLATLLGRQSRTAEDFRLRREAKRAKNPEFVWTTGAAAWGAPEAFDAHRASEPALTSSPAPDAAPADKAPERPVTQPTATPESVVEFEAEPPETVRLKNCGR